MPGWPATTDQAGDRLREILAALGAEVSLGDDGLTVTGIGTSPRRRPRPARRRRADAGRRRRVRAGRRAVVPARHRPPARSRDRPARRARRRAQARWAATPARPPTDSRSGRVRCTAACSSTYDDHRMAHAAAVLGLVVPGIGVEDVATTAKTHPDFVGAWTAMLRVTHADYGELDDHSRFDRPRRRTRPRTKDRPTYDDAVTGFVVTVDRGRYTIRVDGASRRTIVTAMKSRAARPQGRRRRRPGPAGRRRQRGPWNAGPDRRGRASDAPCCGEPPTTPTRSSGSWSPTPTSWSSSPRSRTPSRGRG